MNKIGVLLICIFAWATESQYELIEWPEDNGEYLKWGEPAAGTPAVLTYSLAKKNLSPGINIGDCKEVGPLDTFLATHKFSREQFLAEVQAAFQIWNESGAGLVLRFEEDPVAADVVIGLSQKQESITHARVGLHQSAKHAGEFSSLDHALLCLDMDEPWTLSEHHLVEDNKAKSLSLRMVLAHEIGHILGLNHPSSRKQLMHRSVRAETIGLGKGDRDGIQFLYGKKD